MNTQQLKEELQGWQEHYSDPADKNNYDFFTALIAAVDRLEAAERERDEAIAAHRKHAASLIADRGLLRERAEVAEAEIARRDAAASQAVAWTDDNGLHLLKETVGVMVQPTQERGGNIGLFTAAPPAVLPVVTDLAVELLTAALIDGADAKTALKLAAPGMGAQPQKPVVIPDLPHDCDRTEAHFKYIAALDAAGIPYELKL